MTSLFSKIKKEKKEEEEKKDKEEKQALTQKTEIKEQRKLLEKAKLFDIILAPIITEKSTRLMEKNQYQFKVKKDANKTLIKQAIEEIYGVKVEKVRTIKVPEKPRRLGRFFGKKPGYKKAIVTLKEGYSIEIAPK